MSVRPYVERRLVELEEELEVTFYGGSTSTWWARIYDPLTPTKENIQLSRPGSTAREALEALESALNAQGWDLQ